MEGAVVRSLSLLIVLVALVGCREPGSTRNVMGSDSNSKLRPSSIIPFSYGEGFFSLSNITADGYCSYRIAHRREGGTVITLALGRLIGDTIHEIVQVSDHTDDGGEDAVISRGGALFVFESNRITDAYDIYQVDKLSKKVTQVQRTHYLSQQTLRGLLSYSDNVSGRIVTWGGKLYRLNYLAESTELDLQAVDGKSKYKIKLPGDPYRIIDLDSGSIVMDFKPPLEKCVVIEPPEKGPLSLKEVTLAR
jgi:hypothetical protein